MSERSMIIGFLAFLLILPIIYSIYHVLWGGWNMTIIRNPAPNISFVSINHKHEYIDIHVEDNIFIDSGVYRTFGHTKESLDQIITLNWNFTDYLLYLKDDLYCRGDLHFICQEEVCRNIDFICHVDRSYIFW